MNTRTTLILRLTASTMALMGIFGTVASAQTESDESEKIVQLKRLAAAINLHDILVEKFGEEIEKSAAEHAEELPDGFMEAFAQRAIELINTDDVINDVLAPVLSEYFTVTEMTMLADFSEMPIAQKLITAALNDEKIDMAAMIGSDELSEEEGMKLMQMFMAFGKKKELFEKSNIGEKLNSAFEIYGQTIAMEVLGEMMEMIGEEGDIENAE